MPPFMYWKREISLFGFVERVLLAVGHIADFEWKDSGMVRVSRGVKHYE